MKEDTSKLNFNYSYVPIHYVVQNEDEYIIPENQEACHLLWDKNIFTFMSSNREDGDYKYIQLGPLSEENQEIMRKLVESCPEHYTFSSFRNTFQIELTTSSREKASEILKTLTKPFVMQDVLEGFMSKEEFLMTHFHMYRTIPLNTPECPSMDDYDDIPSYLAALDEWTDTPKTEQVFDETKMEKTFEEYLAEAGATDLYDPEKEIVYIDKFYMDAHKKYLAYLKEQSQTKTQQQNADDVSDPHDNR